MPSSLVTDRFFSPSRTVTCAVSALRMMVLRLRLCFGQDALGDLNDIVVHEKLSEQLVDGDDTAHRGRVGRSRKAFAAGRMSGREEARITPVLQEAKQAYKAFAK